MVQKIEHKIIEGVENKWCGKCKSFKSLDIFGYSKSTWDNYRPTCKECLKAHNAKPEVREARTSYNKQYWQDTMDTQKEKNKKWREENKDYVKQKQREWLDNNKDIKKMIDAKYRETNWERIKERHRVYIKTKYHLMKNDPEMKEIFDKRKQYSNISRRLREIIKQKNSAVCENYVGCSLLKFKCHLEMTMKEGMIWDNHGTSLSGEFKNCWHIDHIIPKTAFDLDHEVERVACNHYKNLRAFWWNENINKHNTYNEQDKKRYMKWFIETQIPYI